MKHLMTMVAVLVCVSMSAQAAPALLVEVQQPTATTWQLWGTVLENTAGLASYAISVQGVSTKTNKSPFADIFDDEGGKIGTIGFGFGDDVSQDANIGKWQLFKYQSTAAPTTLIYGVGVTAQTITSWPGAATMTPASVVIGMPVLLYQGKRNAGTDVTVNYGISAANVFMQQGGVTVETVPVVPEPATLAVLALGGLVALRRRR